MSTEKHIQLDPGRSSMQVYLIFRDHPDLSSKDLGDEAASWIEKHGKNFLRLWKLKITEIEGLKDDTLIDQINNELNELFRMESELVVLNDKLAFKIPNNIIEHALSYHIIWYAPKVREIINEIEVQLDDKFFRPL